VPTKIHPRQVEASLDASFRLYRKL